jgi:hypothetical protein
MVLLSSMTQMNSALSSSFESPGLPEAGEMLSEATEWQEIVQLLRQAAQLAAERNAPSELFMQAAWEACLDARPGLREQIADKELRSQLKKLRKRGLVGAA